MPTGVGYFGVSHPKKKKKGKKSKKSMLKGKKF